MKTLLIIILSLFSFFVNGQVIEINSTSSFVAGGVIRMVKAYVQNGYSCSPSGLILTQIQNAVKLDWTESCTDEDGFEIWTSVDGAAYVLLDTVSVNIETYNDSTEYAGAEVKYKVRAYQGFLYSDFTTESSIEIEPIIYDLASTWINDFSRVTFDGVIDWQTEIYSSLDHVNYTLVTTVAANTNTYDDYTWQGDTVFYKARAKNGAVYGNYTSIDTILTPLVIKYDCNPKVTLTFASNLGLPGGKTVRINWGGGTEYNDYTTTQTPTHLYNNEGAGDPYYVQLSGDVSSITTLNLSTNTLCYNDLSKWILPSSLISLLFDRCKFNGDLSAWVLPSTLTILRLYNSGTGQNTFSGDLSSWSLPSGLTIVYISYNAFTAPPRGKLEQIEAAQAGLYMRDCSVTTSAIDAWLVYANTYFATNTPIKNSLFQMGNNFTTNMQAPTGGNNNTNRLGIIAKYVAAGFTATVTTVP